MPSYSYVQLTAILLHHSWKGDSAEPIYPYDEEDVNTKLGIKRVHGTLARTDYPVQIPVNDRLSFGEYISACNNATKEQIRKGVGSVNGTRAWRKFCKDVVFRAFNAEVERQLMEALVHPQQLLLERSDDKWGEDFTYRSQGVGRTIAQELFGDSVDNDTTGSLNHHAGILVDTAVIHNLDRLRRTHGHAVKNLPQIESDLNEVMKSKHQGISS